MALLLKKAGIANVKALVGGYEEWAERGYPVEKGGGGPPPARRIIDSR